MKRRGFLGFLGGAAVAGPSMAKQAVSAGLNDLSLGGAAGSLSSGNWAGYSVVSGSGPNQWASNEMAKLLGRTAAQHAFHKRQISIHALDPDLAGYRSFALHEKIRLQREREYRRSLESSRSIFEAHIAGWFD